MPFTLNGVGTTYYGKKNLDKRLGVCEHCDRQVELLTYETRLWFVIVFIPIIPLGKRQIIDQCPACTRHRAFSLGEWNRIKRDSIEKQIKEFSRHPEDPEAAIRLHSALVAFRENAEAAELAEVMEERFGDHAEVQLHLGVWYEQEGRDEKAEACFTKALELNPENVAAKRAVAIGCIEKGDLVRARELLSFVVGPPSNQDAAVLLLLANAYQRNGDHEEALILYETVFKNFPDLARDKALRKRVKISEKALGRERSGLPPRPVNYLRVLGIPVLALIALAIAAVVNVYLASHQNLHIVNGLPVPVTVRIDGVSSWRVGKRSRREVTLQEGQHQAVISKTDGPDEKVDFEMRNGFFERFSNDTVFILNVSGAAVFLYEVAIYSAEPDPNAAPPYSMHSVDSFLTFRDIDYAFQDFPPELLIDSGRVKKTRVSVVEAEPSIVLTAGLRTRMQPADLMRFAEHHLTLNPADEDLLYRYYIMSADQRQIGRCRDFLKKRLDRRPVLIEWHRMYQEACKATGSEGDLSQYDSMLEKEPDNSALLYLKGRIAHKSAEALDYYDRAISADPKNAYPWWAKSFYFASRGEFVVARRLCAEACRLKPSNEAMSDMFFRIRFALEQYDVLEAEVRKDQEQYSLDLKLQLRLLLLRMAQGDIEGATEADQAYARKVKAQMPQDPYQFTLQSRLALLYLRGELATLLKEVGSLKDHEAARIKAFEVHLERGDMEEAEKLFASLPTQQRGYVSLLMSRGWKQKGNLQRAQTWRESGIQKFASGTQEEKRVADLLEQEAPRMEELDDLTLDFPAKVSVLLMLAERCPGAKKEFLERARKLTKCVYFFPRSFLDRAIAAMEE